MSYTMQTELMSTYQAVYNHDQQVRDYYDQPAQEGPGKYEGERLALRLAHEDGYCDDDFGDVQAIWFYGRVLFDDCPFIVCFVENSDGFVTEISNSEFEAAEADYIEQCELEEEDM